MRKIDYTLRGLAGILIAASGTAICFSGSIAGASNSGKQESVQSACSSVRAKYPSIAAQNYSVAIALEPGNAVVDPSSPKGYTGANPALTQALSQCLGFNYAFENLTFAGVIPSVEAGHTQFALAGIYDTMAREREVAFVDFEKIKEEIIVKRGNPLHITTLRDLCGHSASEATGYWTVTFLQQRSAQCVKSGRPPIRILQFGNDTEAYQALVSGRVEMHMDGGAGPAAFVASHKGFQVGIGPIPGPYEGVVVNKKDVQLQRALAAAFAVLQRIGTQVSIMRQWKLLSTTVEVSPKIT